MRRRILVTGSRGWLDGQAIFLALDRQYDLAGGPGGDGLTVVHGGAIGADRLAGNWVMLRRQAGFINVREEIHRPDWNFYGKKAGFLRNLHMVELGADVCLAFIRDNSRGATHCASAAHLASIETIIERAD